MKRAIVALGVLSAVLSLSAVSQAETLTPAQKALRSIHRSVRIVNRDRSLLAYPPQRYYWRAEERRCGLDCKQAVAYNWWLNRRHWNHRLAYMRHPSPADCWAFLGRRFHGSWLAHAIVDRESDCKWWAHNPYSSAAGVFQFLDSWGSDAQRLDAVWSINRAWRYVSQTGSWSPWYPLP